MEKSFPQSVYMDEEGPGIAFVVGPDGRFQTFDRYSKTVNNPHKEKPAVGSSYRFGKRAPVSSRERERHALILASAFALLSLLNRS